MIGEVLGNRYELVEKIGEGGMAIVYKARDNKLSRLVAVKVLKKEFANNKDISDKFKKEATAVANFSDANIVNVLDVGHEEEGNIDYFVMEYVNGKTLKELIVGSGKLNYTTAISIAIQIAKALECAHKNNIIHRDVKPQNILVTESGLIKVTDFGIAKSSTSATITNTTTIMGSAHYLSPEQAKGSFVDLRSDIYSLGVVLYEMVTGVLPFDGESPVTIALKHIQSEPIEPKKQNQAIPDSLNNLIMKCMSKECINRYQNCKELIDDLQKIKENPNVSIGTVENYDDGKTIIMEPIRVEDFVKNESSKNTSEESKNKIYTRDDFENDYDDDEDDEDDDIEIFKKSKKANQTNKTNKNKKNKNTAIIIGISAIVLALLLGVGFALGSGSFSGSSTSNSEKNVTIPDIKGMLVDDATKELEKLGLKLKIYETVESDKAEGTILEMSPEANKTAKKGDVINVKVAGASKKVTVPDLRDREINYIKDFLTQKGLNYEITEEYSDNVESGYLIRQYPEKGTDVAIGSTIQLTISKGPKETYVSVSNYIGTNVDKAKGELESKGLVVLLEEQKTEDKSQDGMVLKQTIEGGTKVSSGSRITLIYGRYTETSIDVSKYISVGMTLSDAVSSLESAGISYSISGASQDVDMSSYVVKGFNNKIKKGETVKIQVEKKSSVDNNGGNNSNAGNNSNTGNNSNNGNNGNDDKDDDTNKPGSGDSGSGNDNNKDESTADRIGIDTNKNNDVSINN